MLMLQPSDLWLLISGHFWCNSLLVYFQESCSGFNTDYGSSEPLKTLVMLCYVKFLTSLLLIIKHYLRVLQREQWVCGRWKTIYRILHFTFICLGICFSIN